MKLSILVVMISVLVNLVLVNALECNQIKCPTVSLNNDQCDLSCNVLPCYLDIFTDELQQPLSNTFKSSDCYMKCAVICEPSLLENEVCDSACNTAACGYDLGKCGYCASDCKG
jgi:hypothetical protein